MSIEYSLTVLASSLAVCRLAAEAAVPAWAQGGGLCAVVRTADELSVVCAEKNVPGDVTAERGWRALKVRGPLDFSMPGVLASLSGALADARVSIFAISTFDTDYILVKDIDLKKAVRALQNAGHRVE